MNHRKSDKGFDFGFGRIPPQAIDLEIAVIAALLIEGDSYDQVANLLAPEIFYKNEHQIIVRAMIMLRKNSSPIDILTVTQQLREMGELENVGGAFAVTDLTNHIASAANIQYHIKIVYQKFMQREVIRISMQAAREAYEDTTDVFKLLDQVSKDISKVDQPLIALSETPLSKQVDKTIAMMQEAEKRDEHTFGIPTGYPSLDKVLSGLVPGDLIYLGARPGMGKTSLALNIAKNLAFRNLSVDIYSLETLYYNLIMKLMSMSLQMPFKDIRQGKVDWLEVLAFGDRLKETSLSIQDTTHLFAEDLLARARTRKRQHDTQLIILDYLQLASLRDKDKSMNREGEIAGISRILKKMALELQVPVLALTQLNRSVETRGGDMRPRLSDIRESGAAEQDADEVIFIYRPEMYKDFEYDSNGNSTKGVAFLDIAKNRNGAVSMGANAPKIQFLDEYATFREFPLDYKPRYEPQADNRTKKRNGKKVTIGYVDEEVKEEKLPDTERLPF